MIQGVHGSYRRIKETNVKKLLILGIILMMATTGCAKEESSNAAAKGDIKDPHVAATVGSVKILDSDIEAILSQLPEQAKARYSTPEGKREFVATLAEIKMMSQEAKKKGIDKTADMKRKLDFMNDQLLAKGLTDDAVDKIKVSEEDITKYYNDNKEKFSSAGEKAKLRHILVSTEAEAKTVMAKLKKGADFSKLAKETSKCPSSQQGGDLGWATRGMMVPEFEKVAFALKKGQMSDIVKTQFGYHIIMCDDVEAGKKIEQSDARSTIERQLKNERAEGAVKALVEQVKKEYPVTYNEDFFKQAGQGAELPEAGMPPVSPVQPAAPNESK